MFKAVIEPFTSSVTIMVTHQIDNAVTSRFLVPMLPPPPLPNAQLSGRVKVWYGGTVTVWYSTMALGMMLVRYLVM